MICFAVGFTSQAFLCFLDGLPATPLSNVFSGVSSNWAQGERETFVTISDGQYGPNTGKWTFSPKKRLLAKGRCR